MFQFIILVVFVILGLPGSSAAYNSHQSFTALKFGYDTSSYIRFFPDMSEMTEKFSLCLWIRKLQSGRSPCPFAYKNYEIFMTDSGYYNRLFGSSSLDSTLTSKFTVPAGTFYSYCSTWSLASLTFKVYVNGKLVGTQTTASGRKLQTGGALVLGNYSPGTIHHFGGEMYNFNIYSKELTPAEVATVSASGLCTEIPEHLEKYRVIKWEDILKLPRSGTVTNFIDRDPRCVSVAAAAIEQMQAYRGKLEVAVSEKSSLELSLNNTRTELVKVQRLFNSTQEDLVETKKDLERTERNLNDTRSDLEDTREELETTELELKNVTESKCPLVKGNLTKWDIFYTPPYYNKTFTRSLYQQLRTSWDEVSSRLFGVTMSDPLIKLIKSCGDLP